MTGPRRDWRDVAAMSGRRLFVAVPLDRAATSAVAEVVGAIRSGDDDGQPRRSRGRARVRWVRLDGLHVTLRFLGPTPEEQLEVLRGVIESVAAASGPFRVVIAGAGAFPDLERPRALWLGIDTGADELTGLAASLEAGLTAAGWPPADKPFKPHLTVARVEGAVAAGTARRLVDVAAGLGVGSPVDRVVLFESITGQGPARYEAIASATLGGADGLHGSPLRR